MKLPFRIIAPIIVAIACVGFLLVVLWWQLMLSVQPLEQMNTRAHMEDSIQKQEVAYAPEVLDKDDRALMFLRQGDLLALRGDWAGAEQEYQQSVEEQGGLPALRKLAQAQLQRRNMQGVKQTIKQLKSQGAKSDDLLLLESIVLLRTGELVQARQKLEAATDSPQKSYGLALLSIVEGNHDAAQTYLQDVINGWEPVLRNHAKTLNAAYNEFTLFENSTDIHLITLLSRALAQVQECELALPLLVQVTSAKDDYRDAWIVQGYCELTTEREQAAVISLEQAYSIDPQKPEIQYFLARSYAAIGDGKSAITFFEYAISNGFQPTSEAREYIAKEALKLGNTQLALDQYSLLVAAADAPIAAYEGFITTAIALGKNEEAYLKALEAVSKHEQSGKAHELLGWSALEAGKKIEAAQAFKTALQLDPFLTVSQQKLEELELEK